MKKTIAILLIMILAISLLAGCHAALLNETTHLERQTLGAMSGDSGWNVFSSSADSAPMPATPPPTAMSAPEMDAHSAANRAGGGTMYGGTSGNTSAPPPDSGSGLAEKIIYSAFADIETIDFDETIDRIYEMLALSGAFIEHSHVSGINHAQRHFGWHPHRTANFTLRVPVDQFDTMKDSLDYLGSVTSLRTSAMNITAQFFDTESRMTSFRIEEARLHELLERADSVADMITIEARLSEVRYNIEWLTSMLRNWQSQVDYSTLTLFIYEVERFTEITPIQRSYWGQISDGFNRTLRNMGRFFMDLFMWVAINSLIIVIIVVVAAVAVFFSLKTSRRSKKQQPPKE